MDYLLSYSKSRFSSAPPNYEFSLPFTASYNAAKKAIEIAKKYGFSIKFVNVVEVGALRTLRRNTQLWRQVDGSIISAREAIGEVEEITNQAKANSIELIDSLIAELNPDNIKIEKEVLLGVPCIEILEIAKNEKFDLIVMGNRGFSKIQRFFLGSVSQRVISEASCPVLVIHSDAKDGYW